MSCETLREQLDDYLDGRLAEATARTVSDHLAECGACSRRLQEARDLQAALRGMAVPPPSGDLLERAMQDRSRRDRARRQMGVLAAAASLLLAVAAGWLALDTRQDPLEGTRMVAVTPNQPEKVSLVFNSSERLEEVTLTVKVPEGVELAGYPNQRKLSWRTTLEAGRNVLELPVILRSKKERALAARLEHGDSRREFRLRLQPRQAEPTGALSLTEGPAA